MLNYFEFVCNKTLIITIHFELGAVFGRHKLLSHLILNFNIEGIFLVCYIRKNFKLTQITYGQNKLFLVSPKKKKKIFLLY